jgi:hypothetical protein
MTRMAIGNYLWTFRTVHLLWIYRLLHVHEPRHLSHSWKSSMRGVALAGDGLGDRQNPNEVAPLPPSNLSVSSVFPEAGGPALDR